MSILVQIAKRTTAAFGKVETSDESVIRCGNMLLAKELLTGLTRICGDSMLNYIWAFMIIVGIIYGAFTGNMAQVNNAALDSAKDAVSLCITMLGIVSVWVGFMKIAESSGLIDTLTTFMSPFIRIMFPDIPKGHKS